MGIVKRLDGIVDMETGEGSSGCGVSPANEVDGGRLTMAVVE